MTDPENPRRRRKAPTAKADYEVGYAKPPRHTQFQKGRRSANPKGRPKGSTSVAALSKALDRRFRIAKNGKVVKMTARDIMAAKQVEAAMKGDVVAFKALSQIEIMFNKLSASRGPTAEELLEQREAKKRAAEQSQSLFKMLNENIEFMGDLRKMGLAKVNSDGALGLSRFVAMMGRIHHEYRSYSLTLDPKLKAIWDDFDDYFGQGEWD